MHFNIIQFSPERIKKDSYISESSLYEDYLFLLNSDYGGDEKDYADVIDAIQREMRPFATVNVRRRTIRFRSRQAVERKFRKGVNAAVKNFRKKMDDKAYWSAEYELRWGVTEPFGIDDLFFNNGYCQKISQVIADYLAGYLPQTLHIGAILNAHR